MAVKRIWTRDINGAEVWLVAIKGIFAMKPDAVFALSEKQKEVANAPEFTGPPQSSNLLNDASISSWVTGTHHTKRGCVQIS